MKFIIEGIDLQRNGGLPHELMLVLQLHCIYGAQLGPRRFLLSDLKQGFSKGFLLYQAISLF